MPVDASIYSNVQVPSTNMPSPVDAAEKGMRLSALGMQQAQMGYQMQTQSSVRGAYARNTDPQSGQLNRAGFLSDLGKMAPMAAADYQNQFNKQDKEAAEAKIAQMQSAHQTLSVTTPATQYLLSLPDDQAAKAFPNVMAQLKSQGIPMQNVPPSWDRGWAQQSYAIGSKMKEGLENQLKQTEIAMVPAKFNSELYGTRSPNAEISSQYGKDVAPIKSSHLAMNQMIDNYKNPSPQGDASLILNAFKIKFPNVPDVQSMEELRSSQAVPDKWKNMANQALAGGLDQTTRDNLMRDGISTFRANVNSLRGIQKKYYEKAVSQNTPGADKIIAEPGIDKTNAEAMDIQKQIGGYIPPAERGGIVGTLTKAASKIAGVGGGQSANAAPKKLSPPPPGMVRMLGPDGKPRLIPESSKGEAIAAGGKVVN